MRATSAFRAFALAAVMLAAAADNHGAAAKARPSMTTKDGHVLLSSGGVVSNLTDAVSGTRVKSLFDASDKQIAEQTASVRRRADSNVADLVKGLAANYDGNTKAVLTAVNGMASSLVTALGRIHDIVNESTSDGGQSAGLPWNPVPALRLARPLSDLGGDPIRVMFPVGRELVAEDRVKIYQCKFTYVDAKGNVNAKDFRMSAAVAAEHSRSFQCIAPAWGEGGSLPPLAKWKTAFSVYENEREMPAPKGGAVFNWLPNTPSIDVGMATIKLVGPAKGKRFTHAIKIDYPYGREGYKDVQIKTTSSNTKELTDIKIATSDTGSPDRVMSFTLKKADKAKTATYKITILATSAKTGLKSTAVLAIEFRVSPPRIGKGGSEGIFSADALEFLHKKVGVGENPSETWELCYSRAKHGWSSSTFRRLCMNNGPLFFFQKRAANGYILGGNIHQNYVDNGGYMRTATNEPKAWLFSIKPNNPNKVEIAPKYNGISGGWRAYYGDDTNYLMCFGGGHDMCCRGYDGRCWTHGGHDYRPPVSGSYRSTAWESWAGGVHAWDGRRDVYEVYRVKA